MKMKSLIIPLTMLLATLSLPLGGLAAEKMTEKKKAETPAATPAEKKAAAAKAMPYQVKVASVNEAAKTFTSKTKEGKEGIFSVSDKTKIEKADGSAATFADLKIGETVRGTRTKQSDGKWEAVKVIIGAKEKAVEKAAVKPPKPADEKPMEKTEKK